MVNLNVCYQDCLASLETISCCFSQKTTDKLIGLIATFSWGVQMKNFKEVEGSNRDGIWTENPLTTTGCVVSFIYFGVRLMQEICMVPSHSTYSLFDLPPDRTVTPSEYEKREEEREEQEGVKEEEEECNRERVEIEVSEDPQKIKDPIPHTQITEELEAS